MKFGTAGQLMVVSAGSGLMIGGVLSPSIIVIDFVSLHPLESVTFTVYVPAAKFIAVAVFCTGVVSQL